MMAEIHAIFPGGSGAREAELKLLALRAIQVQGGTDGSSLTATVDEEVVDRALHLIRQSGGTPE
ncbi:hypothetical protein KZ483_20215 [Paenibacillus sp. sptzw28]|uniref:hypothetical protein n=1 Tax=Paenibacillus sp. sptzw28 TaxID=715179 RepID=UPI001C6E61F0|nr:hypothetical protein [Paenibacillus sp. sptzw28]QYR20157.1 hypothetical protein KZ483_20215 [Paenibacillus sp. sptzw28]